MTAKQKAIELFDKINSEIPMEASFNDTIDSANEKLVKDHISTKKICLIVVEEIISTIFTHENSYSFWSEVKSEIELL